MKQEGLAPRCKPSARNQSRAGRFGFKHSAVVVDIQACGQGHPPGERPHDRGSKIGSAPRCHDENERSILKSCRTESSGDS